MRTASRIKSILKRIACVAADERDLHLDDDSVYIDCLPFCFSRKASFTFHHPSCPVFSFLCLLFNPNNNLRYGVAQPTCQRWSRRYTGSLPPFQHCRALDGKDQPRSRQAVPSRRLHCAPSRKFLKENRKTSRIVKEYICASL